MFGFLSFATVGVISRVRGLLNRLPIGSPPIPTPPSLPGAGPSRWIVYFEDGSSTDFFGTGSEALAKYGDRAIKIDEA